MKQFLKFSIYPVDKYRREESGNRLPNEVFQECQRKWPQFDFSPKLFGLQVRAKEGDPVIDEIFIFLREHGREPHLKVRPICSLSDPSYFDVSGERVFEEEDFSKADYFCYWTKMPIGDGNYLDKTDLLTLEQSSIKKQPIGFHNKSVSAICTDALRQKFDAEKFIGLTFREVKITGRKPAVNSHWQLWSDLRMPPLLNHFLHEDGSEYDPKQTWAGCEIDDLFFPYLLKFPQAAVRSMEPFDAAMTREKRCYAIKDATSGDNTRFGRPWIIVSKRFRQWCMKQKLKLDWFPVLLE